MDQFSVLQDNHDDDNDDGGGAILGSDFNQFLTRLFDRGRRVAGRGNNPGLTFGSIGGGNNPGLTFGGGVSTSFGGTFDLGLGQMLDRSVQQHEEDSMRPTVITRKAKRNAKKHNPTLEPNDDIPREKSVATFACTICMTNQVNTVVLPCYHSCLCMTCALTMEQHSEVKDSEKRQCPTCRNPITEIKRIYIS